VKNIIFRHILHSFRPDLSPKSWLTLDAFAATISPLQLRPANSTAVANSDGETFSPYAVFGASVIKRGSKYFVCFGDGFCSASERSLCARCLTWDYAIRNWTAPFSLATDGHKEMTVGPFTANVRDFHFSLRLAWSEIWHDRCHMFGVV
jgi:hypothetical protein